MKKEGESDAAASDDDDASFDGSKKMHRFQCFPWEKKKK